MSFTLSLRLVANELRRLTTPEPLSDNGHLGDKEKGRRSEVVVMGR